MPFPPLDTRLYQAALYLYPPAFREEFAPEMMRDFNEARDEAIQDGTKGILGLWARTGADTMATIASQWMKSGLPVIGLISALGPLLAAVGAAWFWPWQRMAVPANHPQFDIIVLEVFVTTVLFVVVATVLLTFWFTRQMLSRGRARPRVQPL